MEKKFLQFITLSVVFLIGYSYIMTHFYPSHNTPPLSTESSDVTKDVSLEFEPASTVDTADTLEPADEEYLEETEVGEFIVTVSLRGGYIKKIHSKAYDEDLPFETIGFIPAYKADIFSLSRPDMHTIVLENKKTGILQKWEFDGYRIGYNIQGVKGEEKFIIFRNRQHDSGLEQRYQEVFIQESPSSPLLRKPLRGIKKLPKDTGVIAGTRDRFFCFAYFGSSLPFQIETKDKDTLLFSQLSENKAVMDFYVGPQDPKELKVYGLDHIVHYGFLHGIGILLLRTLYLLYGIVHSWGVSIILLSTILYFLMFPFTAQSTKAMKRMQSFQPVVEGLRLKYKDNPQKMNKAVMELYKKEKINPLGSCLPLLFQFPIFIALYQILPRLVEIKGAGFLWIKDLSIPDHTFRLPFALPYFGEFINILPLLFIVVSYFQQKVTTAHMPSQQHKTTTMFVVVIGVIFYHFPACLVLFWLVQNFFTFLYQYRTNKASPAR